MTYLKLIYILAVCLVYVYMTLNSNNITILTTWLCVTIFYCYQLILRIIPALISSELFNRFGITAQDFGTFAGIYYIGYIIVHIPVGLLLDKFGTKKVLPVCVFITAFGLIPSIYSDHWSYVVFGRLLTGVGASAAAVGALQLFRIIFPQHFSFTIGLTISSGLITAVYSNNLLATMLNTAGIDVVINMLIILGMILAALTYFFLPTTATNESSGSIFNEIKVIFCNYKLLIASILAGLMVGPLEGFADAWSVGFINTIYAIDVDTARAIGSSVLTGMCFGCVILPYFADKYNIHYGIIITSGIIMLLGFIYILSGRGDQIDLYITCVVIGVFCAYQVVALTKVPTYLPQDLSGMGSAVVNMIIMFFGSIFHHVIGFIMHNLWDGSSIDGNKIYSSAIYIKGIMIIPIGLAIGVIGFIAIAVYDTFVYKKNTV